MCRFDAFNLEVTALNVDHPIMFNHCELFSCRGRVRGWWATDVCTEHSCVTPGEDKWRTNVNRPLYTHTNISWERLCSYLYMCMRIYLMCLCVKSANYESQTLAIWLNTKYWFISVSFYCSWGILVAELLKSNAFFHITNSLGLEWIHMRLCCSYFNIDYLSTFIFELHKCECTI